MKTFSGNSFFYEDFHRADLDIPYVDTKMLDIAYRAHYHEELEIIYVCKGEVEVTVESSSSMAEEGDVIVILPFHIHSLNTPQHSHLYILKIMSSQLDFSAFQLDKFVRKKASQLQQNVLNIVKEYEADEAPALRRLALKSATGTLLVSTARLPDLKAASQDALESHDRNIQILRTVNLYLQEHWQDDIRLEDVADICHLSLYYFAHTFKKATGTTFGQYLTAFRLDLAKNRMIETKESISEIAMFCGFSSIRTFNRCFLNHFKMTPTEARRCWMREN